MLAEVRALREGIIIADQLPTAMAPEVIKNTNIKLIHRLTSIDDRQLIGSTMSASGIQLEHVAVYRPGEALMSYEGLQRPFELRIQEQKGHGSETPNDDELYDIMLHKPAFFQLAQKEENLKLETLKENVKSLKKKEVEALCALSEYDSSVHTSTQITDFYWHMENIYTSIVILRSQYRRDCQAINELFISAERKAMLDELIRSIGESLQQKIKNNVVFLDSNGQLEWGIIMAENFSIEHSRTKITEVKKTIEDKKQKLDELKQQKKSLMDAGLALDSSNLDSAVQATLMESINDSLRDVENKAYAEDVLRNHLRYNRFTKKWDAIR